MLFLFYCVQVKYQKFILINTASDCNLLFPYTKIIPSKKKLLTLQNNEKIRANYSKRYQSK